MRTRPSLVNTLHQKGYWTIHQLYNYMIDNHRLESLAYPTIHRYWTDGKLTGKKVGGQVRILKDEVIRFLKTRDIELIEGEGVERPSQPSVEVEAEAETETKVEAEVSYVSPPPPPEEESKADDDDTEYELITDGEESGYSIPLE